MQGLPKLHPTLLLLKQLDHLDLQLVESMGRIPHQEPKAQEAERAGDGSIQISMAEDFGVQGRAFYEQIGTVRDVVTWCLEREI